MRPFTVTSVPYDAVVGRTDESSSAAPSRQTSPMRERIELSTGLPGSTLLSPMTRRRPLLAVRGWARPRRSRDGARFLG
jgi:hypothetical protein